jgi:hypothetical protein
MGWWKSWCIGLWRRKVLVMDGWDGGWSVRWMGWNGCGWIGQWMDPSSYTILVAFLLGAEEQRRMGGCFSAFF